MSWLDVLPWPDDAPPAGACVRIERPETGLAQLVFDPPHRSMAVFDAPLLRDLGLALDQIEADASLRGLVLTGRAADQFVAGADVEGIARLESEDQVQRIVRGAHELFARIERSRLNTVAAISGPAPGGACELALCCDHIVLSDHAKTVIGLPEVRLGIFPAWGGVHRLPRRVGIPAALDAVLGGRLLDPQRARRIGLADRITQPEHLRRVAAGLALGRERPSAPRRSRTARWLVDRNPLAIAIIGHKARQQVRRQTRGHYPAPRRALDMVLRSLRRPPEQWAEAEARAVASLATGKVCKNLIRLFLLGEEAKKLARGIGTAQPRPIERAGVIGAGVMGAAIASLLAERGIWTRLADVSAEALDAALHQHRATIRRQARRRRTPQHVVDAALDRLDTARGTLGFAAAEVVIEAVAERLEVKHAVLGGLAAQVDRGAVLASNTSSLSVDAMAEPLPAPERVCGMHFFNPVRKMPLVEVVRGTRTSDATVASACALAVRLGKTPVVVRDVAGFLVNRCLGPYLDEALRLFAAGVDPVRLDRLLVEFGMPMGPLLLLDEVGFDIARHAAGSLHAAFGARMTPSPVLDGLIANRRLGRKSGHGFYRHGGGAPRISELNHFHQRESALRDLPGDAIVDRVVLAMVNEAFRCLDEGVVASADELDLAMVFGTGFAPFRGGPIHYADGLGRGEVARRLRALADAPDVSGREGGRERFAPAAGLA